MERARNGNGRGLARDYAGILRMEDMKYRHHKAMSILQVWYNDKTTFIDAALRQAPC
jgi:hypothetical protein